MSGPMDKSSLTTGFIENKSHSDEESDKAYEYKLAILAVLSDSTVGKTDSTFLTPPLMWITHVIRFLKMLSKESV